ncbi:interferon-induced protein 44-like, partial [Saccostrea echinata]|uniref:interferon-induced protein 44-like n=1 Tax=Saccostrea echinata TaxID=191078 RepID=UPI002A7EB748
MDRSTELLTADDRDQLSQWIGKACHFELLYKISRDGCSASKFHQLCDDKGPTVTVLYNTDNSAYGGFLLKHWNSSGGYIKDEHAFLFTLYFNGVKRPRKFAVTNTNKAAYAHQKLGPTFGEADMSVINPNNQIYAMKGVNRAGFSTTISRSRASDMMTFHDDVNMSIERGSQTRFFTLNGRAEFGSAFQRPSENMHAINNGHMCVFDLEVYSVQARRPAVVPPQPQLPTKTWREPPLWDEKNFQTLKHFVSNYKPLKDMNIPDVNILLVGQIGSGKSSFFNTVNSIFRGEITARACAGNSPHSVTTNLRKYRIRNQETGGYLNFRLCDTRGIEEEMSIKTQDMGLLLDGYLSDQYKFNPMANACQRDPGFNSRPSFKDKIHCAAFIIDGSSVDVLQGSVPRKLLEFQSLMVERGIPQVVYLTKLDKICPLADKDVRMLFYSEACKKALEKTAELIGLPRGHVFPVKNYEKETQLYTPINILVLTALRQTLIYADDYLEDQYEISQTEEQVQLINLKKKEYSDSVYDFLVNYLTFPTLKT